MALAVFASPLCNLTSRVTLPLTMRCRAHRLIRQRAAYEGMPAGISRGKINTTLCQLLMLSEHLDEIIGASLLFSSVS